MGHLTNDLSSSSSSTFPTPRGKTYENGIHGEAAVTQALPKYPTQEGIMNHIPDDLPPSGRLIDQQNMPAKSLLPKKGENFAFLFQPSHLGGAKLLKLQASFVQSLEI